MRAYWHRYIRKLHPRLRHPRTQRMPTLERGSSLPRSGIFNGELIGKKSALIR